MNKQLTAAALAAAGLLHVQAGAADGVSVSGFGTLGVARSDTDSAQFVRYNQAVGVKDSPRIGLDSNLGLQAAYQLNEALSGTVQVLTRKNTSPQFTTELTWAFLKWKLSDEFSLRVGRTAMPAFLISDYQNVGYANTMMRPPIEMYGQQPVESVDGVDFNYQRTLGDTSVTVQGFAGVSRGKLFVRVGSGSVAKYRSPAAGLSVLAEHGPFALRLSHVSARLESDEVGPINALGATLASLGYAQLGKDLGLVGGKGITFTSLGMTMDWRGIVLQSEYARRRPRDPVYVPATDAWYLMAGYRFGKVLPYYAHAGYRGAGQSVVVPAGLAALPPLATTVAAVLLPAEQSSNLVGVRWDCARSVAIKLQVDRVKPMQKSGSLLFPPAAGQKDSVTVLGAAVDFVF